MFVFNYDTCVLHRFHACSFASLSVLPEFVNRIPTVIDMTAGEDRTFNLSAYANPSDVRYTLYREGIRLSLPMDIPRFTLNNRGILTIGDISKTDRGNFSMKAQNSQGSAFYNFSINVRCKLWVLQLGLFVCEFICMSTHTYACTHVHTHSHTHTHAHNCFLQFFYQRQM